MQCAFDSPVVPLFLRVLVAYALCYACVLVRIPARFIMVALLVFGHAHLTPFSLQNNPFCKFYLAYISWLLLRHGNGFFRCVPYQPVSDIVRAARTALPDLLRR